MDNPIFISLATGLVASVAASIVFLIGLRLLTPKVLISSEVSVYPSDDSPGLDTYRVKIVNQRYRSISDLSVQFYVQHMVQVHDGLIKVRTPVGAKFTTHTQTRKRLFGGDDDNARRIRINRDELERLLQQQRGSSLMVEIYGRDGISGFGRVFTKSYSLGVDRFVRGSFKKGQSTEIVPYQGDSEFRLRKLLSSRQNELSPQPASP